LRLTASRYICRIYCSTVNPLEVLVASTEQGNGITGVIDGFPPKGVETAEDRKNRKEFLRKIGYKLKTIYETKMFDN
jgi:adenosine/AMP kinase